MPYNKSLQLRRELFKRGFVSNNYLSAETAQTEREDFVYKGIELGIRASLLIQFQLKGFA